jgi:hypothetical protein
MHGSALTILIIVLVVLALGGGFYGRSAGWYGPTHPGATGYTPSNYGYYHSSGLGVILFILLILLLIGIL